MEKKDIKDWIIFEVVVGSHAYGTNIEGSDRDIKGIYIQPPDDVLQRGYQEQITITDNEVYYELKRFIELCCKGNPTMLEILYSPQDCIVYKHPVMDMLLESKEHFLSKSCRFSFGGYAIEKIVKAEGLDKKMNWEKSDTERKSVTDYCFVLPFGETITMPVKDYLKREGFDPQHCGLSGLDHFKDGYLLFIDNLAWLKDTNHPGYSQIETNNFNGICAENGTDVNLSSIPKHCTPSGMLQFHRNAYSAHCKRYKSYQDWLEKRNVQRYVDVDAHGQKIDGKNMLHCVRLIETGIEIAKEGTIKVRRDNAEYLISIRKGKVDLKTLLKDARAKLDDLDEAFINSSLPNYANRGFFMSLMPKIRKEFYKSKNSNNESGQQNY